MSITGNISTMSLADVLQWLHNGSKTGTLELVNSDKVEREIYFQDGLICSASSNQAKDLIGQYLVQIQEITEEELQQALATQKKQKCLLGQAMVINKVLDEDRLNEVLCTLSEEIIYDLFLWKEGTFQFNEDNLPDREILQFNFDITHVCLEGAQRVDDWKRIHETFPDKKAVLKPNLFKIMEHMPLPDHFEELLVNIDGFRSLEAISQRHQSPDYHTYSLLLDLKEAGFLEFGSFNQQVIFSSSSGGGGDNFAETLTQSLIQAYETKQFDEAELIDRLLEKRNIQHPKLEEYRIKIKNKQLKMKPESVPVLSLPVEEITKMQLTPEEGFVISRINGVWDIKSIIKVSPFPGNRCMNIFWKFFEDGVIDIK